MNTVLKNKLKQIKISREYFNASILDLMNFEYKWEAQICPNCKKSSNTFIIPPRGEFEFICTQCVNNAELKFSHDTRFGIVSHSEIPIETPPEFDVKQHMPHDSIQKLLNTPEFTSIQGGIWMDHCNDFMNFIGIWTPKDFTVNAQTTGRELFLKMTEEDYQNLWGDYELDENETKYNWDDAQYYAFQCTKCTVLKGYWDMS